MHGCCSMFCFSFKRELDTKECRISNRKNVKSIVKSCFVTLRFLSLTINCTGIWQVQLPLCIVSIPIKSILRLRQSILKTETIKHKISHKSTRICQQNSPLTYVYIIYRVNDVYRKMLYIRFMYISKKILTWNVVFY